MDNGVCSRNWSGGGRRDHQPARFSSSWTQLPHPQSWQLLECFPESVSPVSPEAAEVHVVTQPLTQDDGVVVAEKNVGDSEDEMLASSRLEVISPNYSRRNIPGSSSQGHSSGTTGSFEDIRSPPGASASQPDSNTSFHQRSPRVDSNDSDSSSGSQEHCSSNEASNAGTSKRSTTGSKKGKILPTFMI